MGSFKYPVPMEIMKMDILMGTNYTEKWEMGLYRPEFRDGWKAYFDSEGKLENTENDNTEWVSGWEAAGKFMEQYRMKRNG